MKFLRHMSIGIKVLIPPMVLVAALAAVSVLAIYALKDQHVALDAVNDIALYRITLVDEFIARSEQVQSDVFRISVLRFMDLPEEEVQPIYARLERGLSDLEVIYGQILTKWTLDDREQAILEGMKEPLDAFRQQAQQASDTVMDNPSFGILLVRSSTVPFGEFRTSLDELLNYQKVKIVQTKVEADHRARTVDIAIVATFFLIALAGIFITVLISNRQISQPIQAMTDLMRRLAEGELSTEVHGQERRDEIGAMVRALEVFQQNAVDKAETEAAIRESEERYRSIVEYSHAGIIIIDHAFQIIYANEQMSQILGRPLVEIVGQDFRRFLDEETQQLVADRYVRRQRGEEVPPRYEFDVVHQNGETRRVEVVATLFRDSAGEVRSIAQMLDITERKQAEDERRLNERRLNSLLELSQVAHQLSEADVVQVALEQVVSLTSSEIGYTHFVNPDQRTIQLVTWSKEALDRCTAVYESHYPIDQAGAWADCVRLRQPVVHNDYQNLPDKKGYPPGHTHLVRHVSVPVFDSGQPALILGVGNKKNEYNETDVRQMLLTGDQLLRILRRKRAEDQLKAALAEKDVLLREIHHRVKNNMQVVSALLEFQADALGDERAYEAFQESQSRIQSMARIHEQLYQSGDLAEIEMGTYIKELVRDLDYSYGMGGVAFRVDAVDVKLDLEQAIPCGLIINELIANAVKHAFPSDRDGREASEVYVSIHSADGRLELTVRDNGVGLPPGMDLNNSNSLGLRLVDMMTRQLRGTLEVDAAESCGAAFKITFPVRGQRE